MKYLEQQFEQIEKVIPAPLGLPGELDRLRYQLMHHVSPLLLWQIPVAPGSKLR
ncbi:MAG TPA: hypothetical protein VF793_07655 [Telluria sp.]|jgi:hypothetical protein